ncbi:MAG TPA: DUF4964 domain-containing protein, partial [Mucilaginibacter sp.]
MKRISQTFFCLLVILSFVQLSIVNAQVSQMPAYPLINHNTYFSIWSNTDKLYDSPTRHWTGKDQSLLGILKVDGAYYRFMGNEPPQEKPVVPTAEEQAYSCKYVAETDPGKGWEQAGFDDANWKTGKAPFGDDRASEGTKWVGKDIWLRRSFTLNDLPSGKLFLKNYHDDDAEYYLNGHLIASRAGANGEYELFELNQEARNFLVKGNNLLAVHCRNTG